MANRRRPRSRLHAVMRCGLLALLVLFVYWDNTALRTDSLTYTSTALPAEFDGLRIVQLSDLHNREFGKNNQRLYAAVKQAAPDLIFLTGDLVDEYAEAPIPYAKAVGKALSAIAPTYYVTGNHEWAHGNAAVEELKTALRESGVTVLSNQFVPLERNGQTIFIAGIDDGGSAVARLHDIAICLHPAERQRGYLHAAPSFFQMSVSSRMVTGPLLSSDTCMCAPKTPVSTGTPHARSASQK